MHRQFYLRPYWVIAFLSMLLWPCRLTAQFPSVIQQPTFGVSIDSQGVLRSLRFSDAEKVDVLRKIQAVRVKVPDGVQRVSKLRKVSLRRLDEALSECHDREQPPTETMLRLAGLQRIEYVIASPETKDVIVAGPAEGWVAGLGDRHVGLHTGLPTLQLEDLAVGLRTINGGTHWVGCTIDPTPEALQNVVEFNRTIPRTIPTAARGRVQQAMQQGLTNALGDATIRVMGLNPTTRMARVLVEADYRMKRIAIGVEPPPVKMMTFAAALRVPPNSQLQRWWLTPDYEGLRTNPTQTLWQLTSQGVILRTENYRIGPNGQLAAGATAPGRANKLYAQQFSSKFQDIARADQGFAELRTAIDILIVASIVEHTDMWQVVGWQPSSLLELGKRKRPTATKVPCVVNTFWRKNRLLAPAGGGVSINPYDAINRHSVSEKLQQGLVDSINKGNPPPAWWWD